MENMKKSILIEVDKKDKFLCWCANETKVIIVGGLTQNMCLDSMKNFIQVMNYKCSYGYYNDCSTEIISRILKALEV